jgi:HlyD family secretion protein
MLRLLLVLLIVGVVALLGHGYYNQLFPQEKEYLAEKVVKTDVVEQVAVSGAAEPLERRIVQADIPQGAVVEEIFVDYNSPVKKDQILAKLADEEQRLALDRAKIGVDTAVAMKRAADAGLETARSAARGARAKEEAAQKSRSRVEETDPTIVSPDAKSNAELGVKATQAAVAAADAQILQTSATASSAEKAIENARKLLRLAELQIDKTRLKSPIDGFVYNMDIHVGDIVGRPKLVMMDGGSGAPFEIASPPDVMQAVVKLSEADYSRVRVGQSVSFTVEAYPEEKFSGEVTQIRNAPTNDRTATTYPTVIRFKNRKDKHGEWMIRPRATVSADIRIREVKNTLVVPNAALLFAPSSKQAEQIPALAEGEGIVWLSLGHGRITPKKIKKGITNGVYTQILEGDLKEGDPLVTAEPAKNGSGGFQGLPLGG